MVSYTSDSIPLTHCKVQGFGDRSQDGGQALPHSKKILPTGHVGGSTASSSKIVKAVVLGESLTCGSPLVIVTRKYSSDSSISSSRIETLKHTRVSS